MDETTPILFEVSQPSSTLTVNNLLDVEHPVNNKGMSGKRKGMGCMIGSDLYIAEGSSASSTWSLFRRATQGRMAINTFSDFPEPLLPNMNYEIGGRVVCPDELPASWAKLPNNIEFSGTVVSSVLEYNGTADFLVGGDNGRFIVTNVLFDVPNARIYNFQDTTGQTIVNLLTGSIIRCKEVGILNVFGLVIKRSNIESTDKGITFGDKNIIISLNEILVVSDDSNFTWLDFTACTSLSSIDININRVISPSGSVAFKGLPNNANLDTDAVANIIDCVIIGADPLSGIDEDDEGWHFDTVKGVKDSKAIGHCYISTPVSTDIDDGVEVPIDDIFSEGDLAAQSTCSVDGRITMTNRIEKTGTVTLSASVDKDGGGGATDRYEVKVIRIRDTVETIVSGSIKEIEITGAATAPVFISVPTRFKDGDVYYGSIKGIGTNDDITAITESFMVSA